jgi:hypothetical protein
MQNDDTAQASEGLYAGQPHRPPTTAHDGAHTVPAKARALAQTLQALGGLMTVCGSFLRIALRASWFLVGALVYLTPS